MDYLGISLSQTDLVGHIFGPLSREQLDNLLRLDLELGRFFSFLDEAVGPGGRVVPFQQTTVSWTFRNISSRAASMPRE